VTQRDVVSRYIDAFERYDLEALRSILREDVRRDPRRATDEVEPEC
jgi:hypothetical protein